ncbi:hypothetical protein BJV78DRAFT_1188040 [Lactifluus subvellereus]|nr:hypothetical protein BJV78DRAFT_1188040 [Lactifluus subvellereus]
MWKMFLAPAMPEKCPKYFDQFADETAESLRLFVQSGQQEGLAEYCFLSLLRANW